MNHHLPARTAKLDKFRTTPDLPRNFSFCLGRRDENPLPGLEASQRLSNLGLLTRSSSFPFRLILSSFFIGLSPSLDPHLPHHSSSTYASATELAFVYARTKGIPIASFNPSLPLPLPPITPTDFYHSVTSIIIAYALLST